MLASGIVGAKGGFQFKVGFRGVGLIQSIASALKGEEISMTFDIAITDVGNEVEFEITRGALGETVVEIWNINTAPLKVKSVNWSGTSESFKFTVSGESLKAGGPLTSGIKDIVDAEFYLSCQLDGELQEFQPRFYRARVNFTTTSDWATLSILQGAKIIGIRLLNTSGDPMRAEANDAGFFLGQPLEKANAGCRIGLIADLILDNVTGEGFVEFAISKGYINEATVSIFNYNTDVPLLIKQVNHVGVLSIEDPLNTLTFTVGKENLTGGGPLKIQKPATGKMAWAFYYLWYHKNDWESPLLKDRPSAPYESKDFNALTNHIKQARSAGIDGFVASWWGPGDYTDYNFKMLLDAAEMQGFAITAYFETLNQGYPRDEEQITEWLEYLITKYGQHPAYYRLNGKPVIVIWASNTVPLATWHRIFTNLRAKGLDAVYIGMGYNSEILSIFDGLHEYSVANKFQLGAICQHIAEQVRSYPLLYTDSAPKIWIATLQPGYDERTLSDREGFYWERRDGASYRYTFEAAIKSDPDWLYITTWNEWWEHTYIEPSVRYGDLYLQLTREFINIWKRKQ